MTAEDSSADFTEQQYGELLRLAKRSYRFVSFPEAADAGPRSVLWRHDVDLSMHRALALARLEAEEEAWATYYVNPHSPNYNLLEPDVARLVDEIAALGHDLGVHFDAAFHVERGRDMEDALADERELLEGVFGRPFRSFSVHNPEIAGWSNEDDEVAGMVNAYGTSLRHGYDYVSDSNGYWRFRRLHDVLEAAEEDRLYVLTHPEWWVPEAMTPRDRVTRAIEGRAAYQHGRYDAIVERMGRENVGR